MELTWVLSIDENIIQINDDEDIELLGQEFVDITLKAGSCFKKPKKYYLVLEMAISSLECCLPFIAFFCPHLIVRTCKIELGKLLGLA